MAWEPHGEFWPMTMGSADDRPLSAEARHRDGS
jgi:hypothetical protein